MKTSKHYSLFEQKAVWSFICLAVAWLSFFWPTIVSIFYGNKLQWVNWATWGISLATLALIYAKRFDLENTFLTSSQLGLISLLLVTASFVVAMVFDIQYLQQTSVMLMIPALVMTSFGPGVIKTLFFPILYLMLVIPLQDDTSDYRIIIVGIAVPLFFAYWQYTRMHRIELLGEGDKPAWVYQNARWLVPTGIAFTLLMVSPWLGDNIRSFHTKTHTEITLRAPLGNHGWIGPEAVKSKSLRPSYANASAILQQKYYSKEDGESNSIYLYTAYYASDRAVSDMLNENNSMYDPKIWKPSNLNTVKVDVGNNDTVSVLEVTLQAGAVSRVGWYWYYVAGVSTTDISLVQMLDNVRVISKYAQGSGVIFLSTPYTAAPDEARKRLAAFMNTMYNSLDILKRPEINVVVEGERKIEGERKGRPHKENPSNHR